MASIILFSLLFITLATSTQSQDANEGTVVGECTVGSSVDSKYSGEKSCSRSKGQDIVTLDELHYPEEEVKRMAQVLISQNLTTFLNNQEAKLGTLPKYTNHNNLCKSTIKSMASRIGEDDSGEQHYVINPKDAPIQTYVAEFCDSSYSEATSGQSENCPNIELQPGYTSHCQQEYILKNMFVVSKTNPSEPTIKPIRIESCCSCIVESTT